MKSRIGFVRTIRAWIRSKRVRRTKRSRPPRNAVRSGLLASKLRREAKRGYGNENKEHEEQQRDKEKRSQAEGQQQKEEDEPLLARLRADPRQEAWFERQLQAEVATQRRRARVDLCARSALRTSSCWLPVAGCSPCMARAMQQGGR